VIVRKAAQKIQFPIEDGAVEVITRYATNGREAVNVVQISAGIALSERRNVIRVEDVEWVINSSQISPRPEKRVPPHPQIGFVNGLAVYGPNMGMLLELEVTAQEAKEAGKGRLTITGVVEEEEMGGGQRVMKRKSMARGSIENVMTALRRTMGINPFDYDIHVNFPGGTPIDGPSAGVTMATAIYSAIKGIPVDHQLAMTGEVSIRGYVKPVGGVVAKVEAARQAGATRVVIPRDNWQEIFRTMEDIEVLAVDHIEEVIEKALTEKESPERVPIGNPSPGILAASPSVQQANPQ
jgi:Lon-like ATP-dependent protease